MYKIMIVDDEILVRVGLKSTIDWNSLGFELVAEAANGEQAYELFLSKEPDVVLTDIRMPKMDGLKLTELVKAKNPKAKIVILTCYDEFGYVREALKLGASNYILKSEIEDEELINLLKNIHNELDAEMGKIERYSILQRQISLNMNVLKEKLLNDVIDSKISAGKEFYGKCESLGLDFDNGKFTLAVLYKDNMEDFIDYTQRDWQLLDSGLVNIVNEILGDRGYKFLISPRGSNFVILMIINRAAKTETEGVMARIQEAALKYLNISVTAVLSSSYESIFSTADAYRACERDSQQMFYNERGSLICSGTFIPGEGSIKDFRANYAKPLLGLMDEDDMKMVADMLVNIEGVFREKHISPVQAKLHYIGLVNDVLEYYSGCFSENELKDFMTYSNKVLNSVRIADVGRLLSDFTEKVSKAVKSNHMANSRNIIHNAISYIEKNYDKKISLESLAAHINLSKQYLSYIFKRETGENVTVYINRVKVEKAKEMIKKYDYKVKELFDKVGFSDQQYFCKTFKKVTGRTIAEYREEIVKRA